MNTTQAALVTTTAVMAVNKAYGHKSQKHREAMMPFATTPSPQHQYQHHQHQGQYHYQHQHKHKQQSSKIAMSGAASRVVDRSRNTTGTVTDLMGSGSGTMSTMMTSSVISTIDRSIILSATSCFTHPFPPEIEPTPIRGDTSFPSVPSTGTARNGVKEKESDRQDQCEFFDLEEDLSLADLDDFSLDDSDMMLSDFDDDSINDNIKLAFGSASNKNGENKKRQEKIAAKDENDPKTETTDPSRARSKSKKWRERLVDLKMFKEKHGHCKVTLQNTDGDHDLLQWVKRQRYHFKLKCMGKTSPLTNDQVDQLKDIGFVWNSHRSAWDDKLALLEEFREEHGHCRVPRDYDENPPLSTWVKRQRRLYKAGRVTPLRVARLESMGFVWDPRGMHKPKVKV